MIPVNPWVIAGGVLALVLAFGGGAKIGSNYAKGQAAREALLIQQAADAAQAAAAREIAKIKIVNQTNRTRLEREIVQVPVCHLGDGAKRVLDDALTNTAGTDPADRGVVPDAHAPGG